MDGILIPVKVAVKSTKTVRGEIKIIASAALLTSSALKIVVVTLNVLRQSYRRFGRKRLLFPVAAVLGRDGRLLGAGEKLGSALLTVSTLLKNNKMALLSNFSVRAPEMKRIRNFLSSARRPKRLSLTPQIDSQGYFKVMFQPFYLEIDYSPAHSPPTHPPSAPEGKAALLIAKCESFPRAHLVLIDGHWCMAKFRDVFFFYFLLRTKNITSVCSNSSQQTQISINLRNQFVKNSRTHFGRLTCGKRRGKFLLNFPIVLLVNI